MKTQYSLKPGNLMKKGRKLFEAQMQDALSDIRFYEAREWEEETYTPLHDALEKEIKEERWKIRALQTWMLSRDVFPMTVKFGLAFVPRKFTHDKAYQEDGTYILEEKVGTDRVRFSLNKDRGGYDISSKGWSSWQENLGFSPKDYKEDFVTAHTYTKSLLNLEVDTPYKAKKFYELYDAVHNQQRSWNSGKQVDQQRVADIALCPNYNKLPVWVKADLIKYAPDNYQFGKERIGNIWDLIPCSKVWKINNTIPKNIALKLAKLKPTSMKLAACLYHYYPESKNYWDSNDNYIQIPFSRAEYHIEYWHQVQCFLKTANREQRFKLLNKHNHTNSAFMLYYGCKYETVAHLKEYHSNYCDVFNTNRLYIKIGVLDEIVQYFQHLGLSNVIQNYGLIKLAVTFGKQWKKWIEKHVKSQEAYEQDYNLLHDLTYWLPITPNKGLDSFLLKYSSSKSVELEMIATRWRDIPSDCKAKGIKTCLTWVYSQKYPDAKHKEFASESGSWGISKNNYPQFESRFINSLKLPDFEPEIEWRVKNLTGHFLKRNDPRGLYLGKHTNCCQHPHGEGKACAWYGQESANSGFFVVENTKGEIIAQSWAWATPEGLCFDNIESKGLDNLSETVGIIYQQVALLLIEKYPVVTVGTGGNDLDCLYDITKGGHYISAPSDYSGYRDSSSQRLLAKGEVKVAVEVIPSVYVRGLLEEDLEGNELPEVAAACYPSGWRFIPEGDKGFLLIKDGKTIGYSVLDCENQVICDIAVIPQERKYSKLLLSKVLSVVSTEGGKWTADCRESTSYRYLKLMEKRGKVVIYKESKSYETMAGESMFKVSFSVK